MKIVNKEMVFGGFGMSNTKIITPYDCVKIIGDNMLL